MSARQFGRTPHIEDFCWRLGSTHDTYGDSEIYETTSPAHRNEGHRRIGSIRPRCCRAPWTHRMSAHSNSGGLVEDDLIALAGALHEMRDFGIYASTHAIYLAPITTKVLQQMTASWLHTSGLVLRIPHLVSYARTKSWQVFAIVRHLLSCSSGMTWLIHHFGIGGRVSVAEALQISLGGEDTYATRMEPLLEILSFRRSA